MNLKVIFPLAVAGVLSLLAQPVQAQGMNIGELLKDAEVAMNERRWQDANGILAEAVGAQGGNPKVHMMVFGPRFGLLHYRKGLTEVRMGLWAEAIESFEKCYRDYPNDPGRPDNRNQMRNLALLRWAEAAMGLGNWQLAIDQFRKFDEEKQPNDRFNRGRFHTDLATCHFQLGNIPEGIDNLEIAINNKATFDTPETAIIVAFQTLVSAVVQSRNEQVLVDFINKNRAGLTIAPFRMHQFLQVFLKLAGDAFSAEMRQAAILLYQLVPPTQLVIEDARAVLAQLGGARGLRAGGETLVAADIEASIERITKLQSDKTAPEMIKLAALAFIHEGEGNLRGAFTAYRLLEADYSNSERREHNLYNLIRLASMLGEIDITEAEANKFIQAFPDSAYIPTVRRLMLSSLFFNGNYPACIQIATNMLPTLEKNTPEHDLCLFVLAGSYFYTGEYDQAQPMLDEHVETYSESDFLISSRYFQASNSARLQFWQRAGRMLDQFITDFPEPSQNTYYSMALFDRVTVHYAEEQNELALKIIDRLVNEFPDSPVIEQTLTLKGNILQSDGELEQATEAYLKALEVAESRNNSDIAGDAVYFLANVYTERITEDSNDPNAVKAIEYAERFWKEFAKFSPLQPQLAVVQMKPLENLGRFREGLERLRSVISEMARDPEAIGLEEAINSYTEAYLKEYSLVQLREHFFNFPDIRVADRAARALLRIAVIGAYESHARKVEDPAEKSAAEGTVRALFQELKADFNPAELTNFILVKLGDYLRNNTGAPREALAYYDEVLSRPDQSYRFDALSGRADVLGSTGDPADAARALEDFERIYRDSQDRRQQEFALMRMVQISLAKGDFDKAAESARRYLNREEHNFNQYTGRVSLMLAESFDRAGKVNDAISMYLKVWSAFMGEIRVSAPAMKRWMELNWQQNRPAEGDNPSDRQGAYNGGKQYIMQTERLKGNMTPAELAVWEEVEALVRTYEANPSIVPMKPDVPK
jgi:tetratricopeptide (TPR) repeat protein